MLMELEILPYRLSVCRLADTADFDLQKEFFFIGKTDEELSLVCRSDDVPVNAVTREDGWKGLRVKGILDFSLTGVLADLSKILADHAISIFAVSTFNTDYILIKEENFEKAVNILRESGYSVSSYEI